METKKSKRGFAAMSPERRKEIARMGGKAAHALGRGHTFTSEEARAAGKLGGALVSKKLGSAHMSALGKKGGIALAEKLARVRQSVEAQANSGDGSSNSDS